MENVSTRRTERISSDEEERLRLGFEIRSGVRFAEYSGQPSRRHAVVHGESGPLAELIYGDTATLWRINLGWKRRADKQVLGFQLDTERGYWARNQLDDEDPEDPLSHSVRRVIPYVEDWRNCLLIEPSRALDEAEMASLESALRHAIQVEYQLEEMELASEPLPSPKQRRLLLFYESAEGGAGVLRRLVDDPQALPRLARRALAICHFDPETGNDRRRAPRATEDCEAACYDCLLSYINQPDHRILDRHRVASLLAELAHARVESSPGPRSRSEHLADLEKLCDSGLERQWLTFLEERQLMLPDKAQSYYEPCQTRPDFLYTNDHVAVYVDGPHHDYPDRQERDAQQRTCMEDRGWTVMRFRAMEGWDSIVSQHPSVFGAGARSSRSASQDTEPRFEEQLFSPDWRNLLGAMAASGISVDPGRDVASEGRILGTTAAELRRGNTAIEVVDARKPTAPELAGLLAEGGKTTVLIDPTDSEAEAKLLRALGMAK
jgi:hypothetical protein